MKKTVIIGATPNPSRYAYIAAKFLRDKKEEFVPVGIKKGEVQGQPILQITDKPAITDVDTVTMYIGPQRQPPWYDYILSLKPRRIIFNPGSENPEFAELLESKGVEVIEACTLVMLRTNQF
ncbi:MAG TPA: CoA-binding protein [Cyclobacteriaceae bacterium]|nr:CoA-binding protein [Cyclobacteriaceae bacterium]